MHFGANFIWKSKWQYQIKLSRTLADPASCNQKVTRKRRLDKSIRRGQLQINTCQHSHVFSLSAIQRLSETEMILCLSSVRIKRTSGDIVSVSSTITLQVQSFFLIAYCFLLNSHVSFCRSYNFVNYFAKCLFLLVGQNREFLV